MRKSISCFIDLDANVGLDIVYLHNLAHVEAFGHSLYSTIQNFKVARIPMQAKASQT